MLFRSASVSISVPSSFTITMLHPSTALSSSSRALSRPDFPISFPNLATAFRFGSADYGLDHQITTMADSSLQAIKKAVEYLNRKGELFLVVYIGHDEGKKESLLIEEYVASLDHISYNVALFKMMNKLSAPYVIQIEKR